MMSKRMMRMRRMMTAVGPAFEAVWLSLRMAWVLHFVSLVILKEINKKCLDIVM